MGMYDTIMVPCPKCGEEHEAQTKSGECLMHVWTLDRAPADAMEGVNRHAPFYCKTCNVHFEVEFVIKVLWAKTVTTDAPPATEDTPWKRTTPPPTL